MGCLGSKPKKQEEFTNLNATSSADNDTPSSTANANAAEAPKYSWSNRKVDRSNFVVNGKTGETIIREPGYIFGMTKI